MSALGWDAYLAQHDDKPMSLVVDLDARVDAPDPGLPWLQRIRVTLRQPDANGFPGEAEAPALNAIESSVLADENLEALGLRYVGRVTWNGVRDMFLYAPAEHTGEVVTDQIRRALPEHTVEFYAQPDPNWAAYAELLFPDPDSLQTIMNRRVLESLRQAGDDLTTSRDIDHWVYFADAAGRDAFAGEAARLGYRVETVTQQEDADYPHGARLTRRDSPSLERINAVVLELFHLVQRHDGVYDGWETAVVRG